MSEPVGTVSTLSRFPVKSMQGERLETAELTEGGVVGDRAYALVETQTGKVASAKNPRFGAQLLGCRAAFIDPPTSGEERRRRWVMRRVAWGQAPGAAMA